MCIKFGGSIMNSKYYKLALCAIAIAINIVIGNIVAAFQVPFLFLDTIGTLFIALVFGPIAGLTVGVLTNLTAPILMGNFAFSPFMIVSAVIGLVAGLMFRKMKFKPISMIIIGVTVAFIAAFIGSGIKLIVFGGYSGEILDSVFALLTAAGLNDFVATFIPRFAYNLVDKVLSCLLVYIMYNKLIKSKVKMPKVNV